MVSCRVVLLHQFINLIGIVSVAAFIFASVDNYVRVALFSSGRFKTKEYIEKDNCYHKKNS